MRLHDSIYLKTNRHNKPKEIFKFLLKEMKKNLSKNKRLKLLDIGCANGELIYFLNKNLKNIDFYGADIRKDLLKIAEKHCKNSIFKKLDISKKIKINEKFDIIICSGVINIIDDLDLFFKNINKLSKKKTVIYLMSFHNPYNFNVRIKYDDLSLKKRIYQSGHNLWSINYLRNKLKNKSYKKYEFKMPFDIKKNKKDLLRSFSIKVDKKRFFTNGLSLLLKPTLLVFR